MRRPSGFSVTEMPRSRRKRRRPRRARPRPHERLARSGTSPRARGPRIPARQSRVGQVRVEGEHALGDGARRRSRTGSRRPRPARRSRRTAGSPAPSARVRTAACGTRGCRRRTGPRRSASRWPAGGRSGQEPAADDDEARRRSQRTIHLWPARGRRRSGSAPRRPGRRPRDWLPHDQVAAAGLDARRARQVHAGSRSLNCDVADRDAWPRAARWLSANDSTAGSAPSTAGTKCTRHAAVDPGQRDRRELELVARGPAPSLGEQVRDQVDARSTCWGRTRPRRQAGAHEAGDAGPDALDALQATAPQGPSPPSRRRCQRW